MFARQASAGSCTSDKLESSWAANVSTAPPFERASCSSAVYNKLKQLYLNISSFFNYFIIFILNLYKLDLTRFAMENVYIEL